MILDFTDEEIKALDALEESGKKLLDDLDKEIEKLSPYDPKQYEEEEDKLYQSLPIRPQEPEPIGEDENGTPIYRESDMIAYHNSPEYIAYTEENRRIMEAISAHHKAFFDAGSEEFHEAIRRYRKLEDDLAQSRYEFYKKVEDKHFSELENDPRKILEDAFSQVERLIMNRYNYYCDKRKKSDYSTIYVRLQDDDSIKLDTGAMRKYILEQLERHIEALPEEAREELYTFVDSALATNPYVGDTGKKGVWVKRKETTEESSYLVTRPKDYVTTVDRISQKVFKNLLTRPLDAPDGALWDLPLDGEKGKVIARAAIDYKGLIDTGVISHLPKLTDKHYDLHDAIVTHILAGNRKISYEMIYRVMTGKMKGKVTVPDEMIAFYDEALPLFHSRIQIEFKGKSPNGDEIEISLNEPIVTYNLGTAKINGKLVKKVIQIPEDTRFNPPLLKWAQANGNEIDTRDITLLDVPKLNNGDESLAIKMRLYRRLIKMRNLFERKYHSKKELPDNLRSIRFDDVCKAIGLDYETLTKDKKHDIKDKIDKCMKYWREKGFISGYNYKRDKSAGNSYFAVEVSFMHLGLP